MVAPDLLYLEILLESLMGNCKDSPVHARLGSSQGAPVLAHASPLSWPPSRRLAVALVMLTSSPVLSILLAAAPVPLCGEAPIRLRSRMKLNP